MALSIVTNTLVAVTVEFSYILCKVSTERTTINKLGHVYGTVPLLRHI